MDPLTTSVVKAVGASAGEVLKKESESFLSAALGEPAKALGGLLADKVNARRHRNLISITAKANEYLAEAGVTPKEVPLSIIHPALESASLEEDPDLQTIWANLLAHAADPRQTTPVAPSFSTILKDFTIREVKFLDALYVLTTGEPSPPYTKQHITDIVFERESLLMVYSNAGLSRRPSLTYITNPDWKEHGSELQADFADFSLMMDLLKRNLVLNEAAKTQPIDVDSIVNRLGHPPRMPSSVEITTRVLYSFTQLGASFVSACRRPVAAN